ncbi:S41 family peptidase [Pseudoalteromonas ruthenica]|uniref:S41 family peptidase n=1 Tax=Pseudoalteromonas ruthenica TaxID=151081 RepID=UPI00110A0A2D|nr:S41 family peptidase [Pseudoalteromonas ruthenica]TMO48402.1 hypothetical protein CWC24_03930 [Pseudoalteromonas ruthenica]TMO52473.1 hypothetical protein CWC23_02480 [Pseudoalteromonas ruthenica]
MATGQLKLILNEENDGTYKATYYMADHSIRHVDSVGFIDQNHLSLGNNWLTLSRQSPKEESKAEVLQYVQLKESKTPLVQKLSKETALLRIPSFSYTDKKHINTVIRDNLETILNTENLIIDIRGNGGGSDISYEEILPIIYTNRIPEMTSDGKGIQPDFYLDSSIPAYQWVSYTRGMLEEM